MLWTHESDAGCQQGYREGEGGSECFSVVIDSEERGRCSLAEENKCCGGEHK